MRSALDRRDGWGPAHGVRIWSCRSAQSRLVSVIGSFCCRDGSLYCILPCQDVQVIEVSGAAAHITFGKVCKPPIDPQQPKPLLSPSSTPDYPPSSGHYPHTG